MAKMGRPKNPPDFREIMNSLIPSGDIFEPQELEMYNGLISAYLKDFDVEQLSASDMDDIISIAMNRVLELRLLKAGKGSPSMQIDASTAVERVRKQTEKLKENLATRRKDRIDPKKYSGLSIVDLAVAFDQDKKHISLTRSKELVAEEDIVRESDLLIGNSHDQDAEVFDVDSD